MLLFGLKKRIRNIHFWWVRRKSNRYIRWLKKQGVVLGDNVEIKKPQTVSIDTTRPSLVTIGSNVRINKGFSLLTHDFAAFVIRNCYNEFISSSGSVKIGDNVYFGWDCMVLKGVKNW